MVGDAALQMREFKDSELKTVSVLTDLPLIVFSARNAEHIKQEIEDHGNKSPNSSNDGIMPETLESPPVLDVEESSPSAAAGDSRFRRTESIALRVAEPEADTYANSSRPRISKAHKSGESKQSDDVTSPLIESQDNQLHLHPSRPRPTRKHTKPHVLLVEDNIINQRILFRKLEGQGYNVTTANNGQEAVDGVRKAPNPSSGDKAAFDIVLMDNEMPVLDGNEATRRIRKLEASGEVEHIPILGVTANVRAAQQDEMRAAGMDDVISKPYKIGELVRRIDGLIGAQAPEQPDSSPS